MQVATDFSDRHLDADGLHAGPALGLVWPADGDVALQRDEHDDPRVGQVRRRREHEAVGAHVAAVVAEEVDDALHTSDRYNEHCVIVCLTRVGYASLWSSDIAGTRQQYGFISILQKTSNMAVPV